MKTFSRMELCKVGSGYKMHIRDKGCYSQLTLCFCGPIYDISLSYIGIREDAEILCKNCVREYKRQISKYQL